MSYEKEIDENSILFKLREEQEMKLKGGLYHQTQIRMAYNSNHMEGSRLTEDQTRSIYETRTIGVNDGYEKIDDIIETVNHFRSFDYILSIADKELSEDIIKHIQLVLKSGTLDSEKEWFAVGDYKKRPNMIGDMIETTHPSKVKSEIKKLLKAVIWALNKERLINSGYYDLKKSSESSEPDSFLLQLFVDCVMIKQSSQMKYVI